MAADDELGIAEPQGNDTPGQVRFNEEDERTVKRAEAVINYLAEQYLDVAVQDLSNLEDAVAELKANPDSHVLCLKRIFEISHDMKGQGGSFGYPMITSICTQLCRFVEQLDHSPNKDESTAIDLHIATLKMVIHEGMKDVGGEIAQTLIGGLELVVRKISKQ